MNSRFKIIRKQLGLTQTELGEKLGRGLRAIQHYEKGERGIDDALILLLERTFNVNPSWLRTGVGEMFLQESPPPTKDALVEYIAYYVTRLSPEDKEKAFKYIQDLQQIADDKKDAENKIIKEQVG